MNRTIAALSGLLILFTSHTCAAQQADEPKTWSSGDYGPVISTHMDAGGRKLGQQKQLETGDLGNFVFRGRLISLNDKKSANLCFDTEHMRIAAAWRGGYVDWEGAFKNMGPAIAGQIAFQTRPAPGCTPNGSWDDPRKVPEGPLPTEWAQYRGLYLHGDDVVLSYTVGECPVLEEHDSRQDYGTFSLVRNFTLGPSPHEVGFALFDFDGKNSDTTVGEVVSILSGDSPRFAGTVNAPQGTRLVVEDGQVRLYVPKLENRTSFAVVCNSGPKESSRAQQFTQILKQIQPRDLDEWTHGGKAHWPQVLETRGELAVSEAGGYAVDEITAPVDNPWNSWLRFGGVDFFADGRAAISTWDGDVWIVSGIDDDLENLQWRRFATGLQQPLGLKIVDGKVLTAARDQVTRLHDLNDDGEADFYENVNNSAGLTPQRHEYVMDLHTDPAGNLYYCRSGHYMPSLRGENCCVIKLSPDGSKLEVVARGLREPNGMSVSPTGVVTVSDNEGNGIPQTPIYLVEPGDYFGFRGALREGEEQTVGPWKAPVVWLPKEADNSAGGQGWVTSDRWGLPKGSLLHTSYGKCRLFHVMLDHVGDVWQGAAVAFPLTFPSGIMRTRFSPTDGQLYVCGLRGWETTAAKEGTFCRVRYTGEPVELPLGFAVTDTGVKLSFATPLDADSATDFQNWIVETQNVPFGTNRKSKREDEVFVDDIELSRDRKSVTLHLEEHEPVTNMRIEYRIESAAGTPLANVIYATVNAVP